MDLERMLEPLNEEIRTLEARLDGLNSQHYAYSISLDGKMATDPVVTDTHKLMNALQPDMNVVTDRLKKVREERVKVLVAWAEDDQQRRLEDRQNTRDDETFWFRRFMVGLALGNGAAFLALASGILQADAPAAAAKLTEIPFGNFGVGACLSGLIPFFLYLHRSVGTSGLKWKGLMQSVLSSFALGTSVASALAFALGVYQSVHAVEVLAKGRDTPPAAESPGGRPQPPKQAVVGGNPQLPPKAHPAP